MSHLPQAPQRPTELIKLSFHQWKETFKSTFLVVILIVAFRMVGSYFPASSLLTLKWNVFNVHLLVAFAFFLLELWLWSWMLIQTYDVWKHEGLSLKAGALKAVRLLPKVVLGFALLLLIVGLATFVGYWLGLITLHYLPQKLHVDMVNFMFLAVFYLYTVVLFLVALPLIVVDQRSIFTAFAESARITVRHWFIGFGGYVASIAIAFVLIAANHFEDRFGLPSFIRVLVEILCFFIFVPVVVNYVLLIMNDLILRGE
ncbi:MAG TPA: hypothetical protein VJB02_00605 [Coxiellaceae bacterium]|nr:hypothetical protein [Coxiellaceae bacterium]